MTSVDTTTVPEWNDVTFILFLALEGFRWLDFVLMVCTSVILRPRAAALIRSAAAARVAVIVPVLLSRYRSSVPD